MYILNIYINIYLRNILAAWSLLQCVRETGKTSFGCPTRLAPLCIMGARLKGYHSVVMCWSEGGFRGWPGLDHQDAERLTSAARSVVSPSADKSYSSCGTRVKEGQIIAGNMSQRTHISTGLIARRSYIYIFTLREIFLYSLLIFWCGDIVCCFVQ